MKILAFGEIIWDVYPDKKTIGGAPLNFAAHAVRCGAECALVSAVGEDALGEEAFDALRTFGVECQYVKRNLQETGQCIVTLEANGLPRYAVLSDVAYDRIVLEKSDLARMAEEGYDALYFGTLIQRSAHSADALRALVGCCAFKTVFCDVNLRPNCYDRTSVAFCLANATVLKVSTEEEPLLRVLAAYEVKEETPRAICEGLAASCPRLEMILITRGAEGSYAYDVKTGKDYVQAAIGERVVSTVGAGDSFSAAFLTSYLSGESIPTCMRRAAELSGRVVAHTDAVPFD